MNQKMSLADKMKSQKSSLPPHVMIIARAGTGKTTTLIEGLKHIKGMETKIQPSPQQKAIWDAMQPSKDAKTVCFCSFSNTIVNELKERVPSNCEARTLSSLGYGAVRRAFQLLPGDDAINDNRVSMIIEKLTKMSLTKLRADYPVQLQATIQLTKLCKVNLYDGTDEEELWSLVDEYEIELGGSQEKIFGWIPKILERCKQVDKDSFIDYTDQLWLPIVLKLPLITFDLLLVDEVQDCNRCQQELAYRSGRRLVLCGDPAQAIYQFAGADSLSMRRMTETLEDTSQGCTTLVLNETRRCCKAVVREAQRYVPDFKAHKDNPEGEVRHLKIKPDMITGSDMSAGSMGDVMNRLLKGTTPGEDYREQVKSGDMILCRNNAPLIAEVFKFIRLGKKAIIRGRNIAENLIQLIARINKRKLDEPDPKHTELTLFEAKLEEWAEEELRKEKVKKFPSDHKMESITDRRDCLKVFIEECKSVVEIAEKINSIFTDKSTDEILLSSVHKAKGLEAKRVFWIQVPKRKKLTKSQIESENNIAYVAITRAIEQLNYVS